MFGSSDRLADQLRGDGGTAAEIPLTRVLTDFACLLADEYEVGDALEDLVEGVSKVLEPTVAGVSLVDGDRLRLAAAGNEQARALGHLQEETQDGPAIEAHRRGRAVLVTNLADPRSPWTEFGRLAADIGVVAVAGIPMSLDRRKVGALTIYQDSPRAWCEEDVRMAKLLADITTGYVANAFRLDSARQTVQQLQGALDSRVIIEQAKGVLAGERKISVDEAFQILRAHARSHNASLRSVADAVVNLRLRP